VLPTLSARNFGGAGHDKNSTAQHSTAQHSTAQVYSKSEKNQLYYGDNLDVLRRKIPSESVDLCYIDPPFNSKRNYFQIYNNQGSEDRAQAQAFVDTWEWGDEAVEGLAYITDIAQLQNGKLTEQTVELIRGLEKVLKRGSLLAYLVHMTLRIVEIHRVLKPTGSFYLHCDPTASHYLKLVLDAVFCGQGGDFKNEIVWERLKGAKADAKQYGRNSDRILFYTKSGEFHFLPPRLQDHNEKTIADWYNKTDDRGRYVSRPLTAAGPSGGDSGQAWRGKAPTGHWTVPNILAERYEAATGNRLVGSVRERLDILADGGLIDFSSTGLPSWRRYLDEAETPRVHDIWADEHVKAISRTSSERLGYDTQKPESLLERIILSSSPDESTILDAYCGCGTTVAVAQRLGRRWIGIDITYQSISLILKRFKNTYKEKYPEIEANILLDGVPRDVESAVALANRKDDKTRKEFEKWAVLTYSDNQARINEKKGADAGIDGIAFFHIDNNTNGKAIFQVKSGGANRATLATLNSDRLREKAEFGILLTMDAPTKAMREEVMAAGKYRHPLLNRDDDRIQIVTVEDIIKGKRMVLPMARTDAVKSAKAISTDGIQTDLL
jgi:DNA modification methylase